MKGQKTLFSKNKDEWSTPKEIYDPYIFQGFYDPCPIDPEEDGLKKEWKQFCFVNPPYSEVGKWLHKAQDEIDAGNTFLAVFLVFARVDTKWFHNYVEGKHAYKFIKGRLKFGESKNSAPAPSMLIYMQGALRK